MSAELALVDEAHTFPVLAEEHRFTGAKWSIWSDTVDIDGHVVVRDVLRHPGAVAVAGRRRSALPVWSVRVAAVVALLGAAGNLIQFGPGFAWFGLAGLLGLVVFSVALAVPMIARNRASSVVVS